MHRLIPTTCARQLVSRDVPPTTERNEFKHRRSRNAPGTDQRLDLARANLSPSASSFVAAWRGELIWALRRPRLELGRAASLHVERPVHDDAGVHGARSLQIRVHRPFM